ncbi:YezD family protein [Nitrosomonas sp.]|uniref:YezD family protein n=1 Tax=Nitrosomonas sp. TaxID=42353 RepID=UPI0025E53897|nr:YezD family protein [Nitrosomonas sp.]
MTTDSSLEHKIVANNDPVKKIPTEVAQEILRAVANIEYGSIEITIHGSRVVQIECREKIRVNQSGPNRKTLKS